MPRKTPPAVEIPYLDGWITLPEAGVELGVSSQRVHVMIREGKIKTARKLGRKPLYIVREVEIAKLANGRAAAAAEG